ncbi:MAG TPA: glycosyltransferase family 39 protein [Anaerolineae bacterium]|nr:glycosyltransferase family 39 protein [Anaerolineae bacterium]
MHSRPLPRFFGLLLALALAYAGQYLLNQPDFYSPLLALLPMSFYGQPTLAIGLLLAGALLFALAAPAPAVERVGQPAAASRAAFDDHPTRLSQPFFVLALLSYGVSAGLYLFNGETVLLRGLWLAGIVLLVASQTPWHRWRAVPAQWRQDWRSYGVPALLLLVAAFLRLYKLADLPQDLHGDMASHGLQALELLAGRVDGIVALGWADIPMLGFLPTAVMMRLSGDTGMMGLGLASALGGVLSVWGLYVWLHELLGRRVALIGAALLAVSFTHIHFSRIAEYMDPVPFAIWSLALLTMGLRRRQSLPFVLSGVLLAGSSLMYYSGRVMLVVVALFLLYLLLVERRLLWANRRGLLWLGLGAVVAMGPMLVFFLLEPAGWLQRSREVWVFNPPVLEHSRYKYGVETAGQIMLEQARRSLLLFNLSIDSSTQFGFPGPLVDSVTGPLVVLGTAYALAHPRRWATGLLAIALLAVVVVGSILTDNPPFWPRLVFVLAPAMGLAAVAIDRAWDAVTNAFGQETSRILVPIVVGMLLYVGLLNWTLYYQFAVDNGRPRALVGRLVAGLSPDAAVCIVPDDDGGWIHAPDEREIAFFMGERPGYSVELDGEGRIVEYPPPCLQAGAVWIVPQPRQSALSQIQQRLPGSVTTAHGRRAGEVAFFAVHLP